MSDINLSGDYTTIRVAESIQSDLRTLVTHLKKLNRRWNKSALINLACMEFLASVAQKNDKEIEGLFDKYEQLLVGKGKLK